MLRWVRLNRYCELSGETADAVEKRLRSGHWLRDVHARVPQGSNSLWVNLDAVEDWAAGAVPAHLHGKRACMRGLTLEISGHGTASLRPWSSGGGPRR